MPRGCPWRWRRPSTAATSLPPAEVLRPYGFEFLLAIGEGTKARELRPHSIRINVTEIIPKGVRALASYGLMGLYFGLLTAGRRGQTLGKRLFGIRVARLDGHRLSLVESVERFVGYLHIPGSLGISVLDLWRDPNRRMAHDRVAHTAVVRAARVTKRAPAPHPASEPALAPPPPTTEPSTVASDR